MIVNDKYRYEFFNQNMINCNKPKIEILNRSSFFELKK